MDLDFLLNRHFPGKVVRKDLTKLVKEGANVPVYVLEYLLGNYCASNDEAVIEEGLRTVKKILAENYVRPDEAEKVKSTIRERGSLKIIDKVTVTLNEKRDVYEALLGNLGVKGIESSQHHRQEVREAARRRHPDDPRRVVRQVPDRLVRRSGRCSVQGAWCGVIPMDFYNYTNGAFIVPIYTYRNFPRKSGLTVEQSLAGLGRGITADIGVQIPDDLITDCVRLCCSLCLLENDPEIISPDVLSKDRDKFDRTGEQKYVEKAHRRGKVGWDVGRHVEVVPHYRRPHLMLAWAWPGRAVPKIVPRRGTIVHRSKVETVPSGSTRNVGSSGRPATSQRAGG